MDVNERVLINVCTSIVLEENSYRRCKRRATDVSVRYGPVSSFHSENLFNFEKISSSSFIRFSCGSTEAGMKSRGKVWSSCV